MKRSYYPDPQDEQADWYENVGSEFPALAAGLGFLPAETADIVADCSSAVWLLRTAPGVPLNFGVSVTGYIQTVFHASVGSPVPVLPIPPLWPAVMPVIAPPGIDERRQKWVEKIKASKNYTPDVIGLTLRTEGTSMNFDPAAYKAVLQNITPVGPSQARVKFRKAGGEIDGINLYSQLKGEMTWRFVKFYSLSPALDTTPVKVPGQAEERFYKARAVVKDHEIGLDSDIVSAIIAG